MSLESVLSTVGNDLKGFASKVAADWSKVKQAWTLISSPQTRALMLKIFADAVKLVKDGSGAVSASGTNLLLDVATLNDIKILIADAKAGDNVIVSDLKVLGITF
jgi:hypothetical protein